MRPWFTRNHFIEASAPILSTEYDLDMDAKALSKVNQFFSGYPIQKYKKNQVLLQAGDNPKHVYYVISGKIKEYDITYRGDEAIVNIFKAPAFFPMSYAMNKTPNEFFFETDSAVELRMAPIDDVLSFVKANPEVLYDLLVRVYRGTDGLLKRLTHLMASPAKARITHELIVECLRFGTKRGASYSIDLTESDIGARAGLARETVSRELHKLVGDDLIDISNGHIKVLNLQKLRDSLD
jgi:CRP-like cAMP-binding protein